MAIDQLPPDFYATKNFTDKMIEFLDSNDRETPWFAYVPYTAPHWPLQLPEDWLDRHAGRYDSGYDVLREFHHGTTATKTSAARGPTSTMAWDSARPPRPRPGVTRAGTERAACERRPSSDRRVRDRSSTDRCRRLGTRGLRRTDSRRLQATQRAARGRDGRDLVGALQHPRGSRRDARPGRATPGPGSRARAGVGD